MRSHSLSMPCNGKYKFNCADTAFANNVFHCLYKYTKWHLSLSCAFTLHAGHFVDIYNTRAPIKAGTFLMSTTAFIKENQWEVRGLTDVTATLRHKENRKGGFGLGSCILMASLWQWKGLCCCGRGAAQCCSGGGGELLERRDGRTESRQLHRGE